MKKSAGIILYRHRLVLEFLLAHPGGPFYTKKDLGVWTIPKGEFEDPELPENAAKREFAEEVGFHPENILLPLDPVKQKSGKLIYPFAVKGDFNPEDLKSNLFTIEWPPRSGKQSQFPEVDKVAWFTYSMGIRKIIAGQIPILEQLKNILSKKT